ncbi:MAG TPA: response regulator [Bacteroidota bacterium]
MDAPKPIRVLIAEDENSFRMVLQRVLLPKEAYTFEACASGDEVLEKLREQQFDVIILDYDMPGRSGLNILQWMLEQKMDTPVIMLTGAGSENIAVEAMKLGAYDYIRKERFAKDQLPHIINTAHEQYLFRKERALRERQSEGRTVTGETFALLSGCVRSVATILDTSLATTRTELDKHEKELLTSLPAHSRELVSRTFSLLRKQYGMMAFGSKSLLDLSKLFVERLRPNANTEQQRELMELLERLEAFSKQSGLPSE